MSAHPYFSMVVEHLVEIRLQGMLVRGRVDGGEIHLGDAVQVGEGSARRTVEVGSITIGKQPARVAAPGMEASLLLAGLAPGDVHRGDRLLPGRAEEVSRPPEEEPWQPLPLRIFPIRFFKNLLGSLVGLAVLGIFAIIPAACLGFMYFVVEDGQGIGEFPPTIFLFFALWYGAIGFMIYRSVRGLNQSLRGGRIFKAGNATVAASILRRRVVTHEGKYGDTQTFHFQVEFTPTKSLLPTGSQRFELQVSQKLYEQSFRSPVISLTYATQDPQIFVIEGE